MKEKTARGQIFRALFFQIFEFFIRRNRENDRQESTPHK